MTPTNSSRWRAAALVALLAALYPQPGCSDEQSHPTSGGDGSGAELGPSADGFAPPEAGTDGAQDGPRSDGAVGDAVAPDAAPPAKFSFVVFGDNQFATDSCTSGVPERLAVPEAVVGLAPTFVLHTGDLVDHSYETGAYAKLVSCYSGMLAKHPFFPTMGNHDAAGGGIWDYKTYLEEQLDTRNPQVWGSGYPGAFQVIYNDDPNTYSTDPGNPGSTADVPSGFSFKTFYALRHQNAYFVSFEQGTRWWADTPKSWVEKHLKAARADPTIEHLFVQMHHPMYSTTMAETATGECIEPVRKHYEPLFRQYDVTMVFSGHAHLYDRFYVPDDGAKSRQSPPPASYPHDGKGIHYIVTGGGGGALNACGLRQEKSYDYSQSRACVHHVTQVEVTGKQLAVSIVQVQGSQSNYTTQVIDSFTVK